MEIISRNIKPSQMMHDNFAILLQDSNDIKKWFRENALNYNRLRTVKPQDVESITYTFTHEYKDKTKERITVQLKRNSILVEDKIIDNYLIDIINDEFDKFAHPLIFIDDNKFKGRKIKVSNPYTKAKHTQARIEHDRISKLKAEFMRHKPKIEKEIKSIKQEFKKIYEEFQVYKNKAHKYEESLNYEYNDIIDEEIEYLNIYVYIGKEIDASTISNDDYYEMENIIRYILLNREQPLSILLNDLTKVMKNYDIDEIKDEIKRIKEILKLIQICVTRMIHRIQIELEKLRKVNRDEKLKNRAEHPVFKSPNRFRGQKTNLKKSSLKFNKMVGATVNKNIGKMF